MKKFAMKKQNLYGSSEKDIGKNPIGDCWKKFVMKKPNPKKASRKANVLVEAENCFSYNSSLQFSGAIRHSVYQN